ncbi:MAG: type II toxin-antitoxin system VapC family toxin [Nostoc sp. NMS1]|uniref:type II toxin-antitoxin system VapC family toxin n=1 Tax=unclassified Nostoc TaxID=2593658 RepID=UPI0025CFD870|nr:MULTISPECIES: type II toxin-antitoxin system VapC family toxin [unclassified Nostoc]MBN3910854.1 type II toxin-antitoxin system VapC family toxin [Nostoc sp. NMS1]MBN3994675.1 type II toxin-antitoxin system VapC family toxin [Nostoc sp. NMS2]
MKPALIDTDILSLFFRGNTNVVAQFQNYLITYRQINISIITYYEILSGLKHCDAQKQLALFLEFVAQNTVLPLTEQSVTLSADIYANLRLQGIPIDDIDLLIAGVAIANNLVMITHNQRHFGRVEVLELQDWSQA